MIILISAFKNPLVLMNIGTILMYTYNHRIESVPMLAPYLCSHI